MPKRKHKTVIFMLIILLVSPLFPSMGSQNIYAEESGQQQLKDLNQGEEITFAGSEWIVLDPDEGYIFSKESIGTKPFDNESPLSNRLDPEDENNLAYYLNEDYYNEAFTFAEQAVIEERTWGIESIDINGVGDGNEEQVNANVGLLSYEEWIHYSKDFSPEQGFLDNPEQKMWLRTPFSTSTDRVWQVWEVGYLHNLTVDNTNAVVYPALTLESDIFVSSDNEVIVPELSKQLKDLDPGDEITFSDKTWIVLDPDEGYIFSKESIGWRPFDSDNESSLSNRFDPEDESQLAHYLNEEYYNEVFTSAEQAVIEERMWGIDEGNEEQVNANVGLLSNEEWMHYSKYFSSEKGFLDNPEQEMWLRTYVPNDNTMAHTVSRDGDLYPLSVVFYFAVHPTLTLKSDNFISDDNEVMVTDVMFDPNGGGDTWAQEYELMITVNKFVEVSEGIQYAWATEKMLPNEGWEALTLDSDGQSETILTPEKATGEYYLHIQGTDMQGEDFHLHSEVFQVDNTSPNPPEIKAPDEWTNEEVTVMITAGEDDHSGVDKTEYRLQEAGSEDWGNWHTLDDSGEVKLETEGETKLEARTLDQAENQSNLVEATVKIDKTEPEIAFDPNGNANAAQAVTTKVTVTDEGSGLDEDSLVYTWSESDDAPDKEVDWEAFDNEEELTKAEADGDWYLHIQATDHAGNQTQVVTNPFILNNTPPEAPEIRPATTDWTNDEVEVTIEAEENVVTIEYQLDGTEEEGWSAYEEAFPITKEGKTTIYARAMDEAGNSSDIVKATVKIDQSNPDITIDMTQGNKEKDYENNTWTNQTVYLFMEATDPIIKEWAITVNEEELDNVDGFTHAFSIAEAGTYTITLTAVDQAGNQAEETRTIRVDQTPPSDPSIRLSEEGWTNAEEITTSITAGEDQESGVDQTQYRIGEGEWLTYDQPLSTTEAGETKIEARTIDKAGNVSDITDAIVQIKRSPPNKPEIDVETGEWTNADTVVVELRNGEGDGTIEYQLNENEGWSTYAEGLAITEEGITTVYARTVDKAGNESDVTEARVKIDRTDPALTLLGDNPMFVGYKAAFEDPGYEVEDNFSDDVAVEVTGKVNSSQTGVYELTYTAQDQAGNETSKTRTVHVVYETSPIIHLNGDNPLRLEVDTAYEELGATAINQAGDDISDQMNILETIDITKLGIYHVTYEVEDDSGNTTKVTRAVEVVDTTAPEVTLNGETAITLELGDSYEEPGAVATDNYDGDISEAVAITGGVNTSEPGTYHVTYIVKDSSDNIASATREVRVKDTTAPTDLSLEATEVMTEEIVLTFSAKDIAGIKKYILSRDGEELARIDGEAVTFTDQTVEAGMTYQYELAAIDPSDNTASATVEVTTEKAQGMPVEVIYVDEAGNALADSEELTGKIGEVYHTEAKEIEGYELIENPENVDGVFTKAVLTVTYVYVPVQEEPKEPEIPASLEIILDEPPVEVFPGITVTVKDTQTTIQLPATLPPGTMLQVHTVEVEEQEGLTQAGEVYDFLFTYPDGQKDYSGDFTLTMGVTDGREEAGLYHYRNEWQRIGGTIEGNAISTTVSDFSIYGVFVEEEIKEEPPVKEESSGKEKPEVKEKPEAKGPAQEPKDDKSAEEEPTSLPATATNQYNWVITGIVFIVLGSGLWFIHRKRKYNEDHL
ncbi:OmpL47-type beta-barrel domain-containing protein [Gracilibacillus phocaeensis]|uniref:OmpL47-type beta-barrel domain-containing protein n=1 Tax=Gracilibacillus phocaeensis TaxID=2042304 RepID=UPI0013EF190F|nr:immunoglobulin-like domain-containing protein [Gracilibacillus phocaeensis]